ncbi:MAG: glycosyltransferase family 4 protein [marine benthic group bacterium]|nr:glycosyltransferase family 4 protein [Candidatus Carthagonibacter metallireducens]
MRILVVNWQDRENPRAGGAEIHLHEIFGRLAARGHDVTLLCSGWTGAPTETRLDGMRVVRAGTRYTFALHALSAFKDRLEAGREFDVIVEDINKCPLFCKQWSSLPVVALVPHLFGATAFRQELPPVAAVVWTAEKLMPAAYAEIPVLVISESTSDDLVERGFQRDRISVSYPGIDHGFFRPAQFSERLAEPTIVYAGRLQRYKSVDIVLRALALLRDRGAAVQFRIAGQGEDRQRLETLVDSLALRDLVTFAGYVTEEEKRELMRRAWAHVYPSPKEGWGISNIEAAACGTPSLASDAPGLRESVLDGVSGYLVPHGDVEKWADAIGRLAADPALRDRLGQGAIGHAARFTWDQTADETEAVLRKVV